jgi:hypothetical protein
MQTLYTAGGSLGTLAESEASKGLDGVGSSRVKRYPPTLVERDFGFEGEKMNHRHYCSSCCGYWDHEDHQCANAGRAMTCPRCLNKFMGGKMSLVAVLGLGAMTGTGLALLTWLA